MIIWMGVRMVLLFFFCLVLLKKANEGSTKKLGGKWAVN